MTIPDRPRVLVVDDEQQMLTVISFALETYGFDCVTVDDSEKALESLVRERPDLVIADVMLPGMSGVELCERIRSMDGPPVLLLTARGEVEDRLEGLEAGADDYLAKPFHPRELALRANRVLRRPAPGESQSIAIRGLQLDLGTMSATIDGSPVTLSPIEFRFLVHLGRRRGEPVSTSELLRDVWRTDFAPGGQDLVKATVHRIRIKLGEDAKAPSYLVTLRGIGYMMPA
jgi:DNA-binding response OmpR family regulator